MREEGLPEEDRHPLHTEVPLHRTVVPVHPPVEHRREVIPLPVAVREEVRLHPKGAVRYAEVPLLPEEEGIPMNGKTGDILPRTEEEGREGNTAFSHVHMFLRP